MNNNIKGTTSTISTKSLIVLSIIAVELVLVLVLVLSNFDILGIKTEVGDIKPGDEVFVVNESINNQAWIVKGTVIEIKYQDKKVVEYIILLPQVTNSTAIYSAVFYGIQENIFLTYNQALKYLLNN